MGKGKLAPEPWSRTSANAAEEKTAADRPPVIAASYKKGKIFMAVLFRVMLALAPKASFCVRNIA
jgi:hypothetical protein